MFFVQEARRLSNCTPLIIAMILKVLGFECEFFLHRGLGSENRQGWIAETVPGERNGGIIRA